MDDTKRKRLEAAITPSFGPSDRTTGRVEYTLKPCEFSRWLKFDSLPVWQACFVLLGCEPPPLDVLLFKPSLSEPVGPRFTLPNGYSDLLKALMLSVENGTVTAQPLSDGPHVPWATLITWAKEKAFPVHDGLNLGSKSTTTHKVHKSSDVHFSTPPELSGIDANGNYTFNADGYAQYLKEKSERNAQGRYTVAEAAQVLAEAHGLEPATFIERRMLPAIDTPLPRLRVTDPADGGPLKGRKCRVYADEVTPAGIDEWLSAEHFAKHMRWPEPAAISASPDDVKTTEQPPPPSEPPPLPTNTIAQLFDGIEFTQDRWIKNIGQAKWLASANRGKGEQGGAPATWCPLTIAQLVYARKKDTKAKQKTLANLNSRFRTNPVLKPWKDSWDDYYGMFTEPGEA